jgi:hypothetical protein
MRVAFHDLKEFPALRDLAQAWPRMRQDVDALAAPLMAVDCVGKSHERVAAEGVPRVEAGEPFSWVRGWAESAAIPTGRSKGSSRYIRRWRGRCRQAAAPVNADGAGCSGQPNAARRDVEPPRSLTPPPSSFDRSPVPRGAGEVAAPVMRVTETAHWREWQDWVNPLKEPFEVRGRDLHIPERPGGWKNRQDFTTVSGPVLTAI